MTYTVEDTDADLDLPLLHERNYSVRAYQAGPTEMLVRGSIKDVKPPGLMVADDPEPLVMHHMVVDLRVSFPSMEITSADVVFEAHPHGQCPQIAAHYQSLVGLSVTRGFTTRVRELFGGPRGCTHTTALLQAMAPVVVQSSFGMVRSLRGVFEEGGEALAELRRAHRERNVNTCHVWAEGSELNLAVGRDDPVPLPIPIQRRRAELDEAATAG